MTYDFNKVDTRGATPESFPGVQAALGTKQGGITQIDSKQPYAVPGEAGLVLGTITLRLQGELSSSCEGGKCMWSFEGTLKAHDDTYDFNASTHRSATGEALTTVGRTVGGTPYQIEIRGEKKVETVGAQ